MESKAGFFVLAQLCPLHSNPGPKTEIVFRFFYEIKLTIQMGRVIIPLYKSKEPVASGKTNIAVENPPFLIGDTSSHGGFPSQLC